MNVWTTESMDSLKSSAEYAGEQGRLLLQSLEDAKNHSQRERALKTFKTYISEYKPSVYDDDVIPFLTGGEHEGEDLIGLLTWCGQKSTKHHGGLKRSAQNVIGLISWLLSFSFKHDDMNQFDENNDENTYLNVFLSLNIEEYAKMELSLHVLPDENGSDKGSRSGSATDAFDILSLLLKDHKDDFGDPAPLDLVALLPEEEARDRFSKWLQDTAIEEERSGMAGLKKESATNVSKYTSAAQTNEENRAIELQEMVKSVRRGAPTSWAQIPIEERKINSPVLSPNSPLRKKNGGGGGGGGRKKSLAPKIKKEKSLFDSDEDDDGSTDDEIVDDPEWADESEVLISSPRTPTTTTGASPLFKSMGSPTDGGENEDLSLDGVLGGLKSQPSRRRLGVSKSGFASMKEGGGLEQDMEEDPLGLNEIDLVAIERGRLLNIEGTAGGGGGGGGASGQRRRGSLIGFNAKKQLLSTLRGSEGGGGGGQVLGSPGSSGGGGGAWMNLHKNITNKLTEDKATAIHREEVRNNQKDGSILPTSIDFDPISFMVLVHGQASLIELIKGSAYLKAQVGSGKSSLEELVRKNFDTFIRSADSIEHFALAFKHVTGNTFKDPHNKLKTLQYEKEQDSLQFMKQSTTALQSSSRKGSFFGSAAHVTMLKQSISLLDRVDLDALGTFVQQLQIDSRDAFGLVLTRGSRLRAFRSARSCLGSYSSLLDAPSCMRKAIQSRPYPKFSDAVGHWKRIKLQLKKLNFKKHDGGKINWRKLKMTLCPKNYETSTSNVAGQSLLKHVGEQSDVVGQEIRECLRMIISTEPPQTILENQNNNNNDDDDQNNENNEKNIKCHHDDMKIYEFEKRKSHRSHMRRVLKAALLLVEVSAEDDHEEEINRNAFLSSEVKNDNDDTSDNKQASRRRKSVVVGNKLKGVPRLDDLIELLPLSYHQKINKNNENFDKEKDDNDKEEEEEEAILPPETGLSVWALSMSPHLLCFAQQTKHFHKSIISNATSFDALDHLDDNDDDTSSSHHTRSRNRSMNGDTTHPPRGFGGRSDQPFMEPMRFSDKTTTPKHESAHHGMRKNHGTDSETDDSDSSSDSEEEEGEMKKQYERKEIKKKIHKKDSDSNEVKDSDTQPVIRRIRRSSTKDSTKSSFESDPSILNEPPPSSSEGRTRRRGGSAERIIGIDPPQHSHSPPPPVMIHSTDKVNTKLKKVTGNDRVGYLKELSNELKRFLPLLCILTTKLHLDHLIELAEINKKKQEIEAENIKKKSLIQNINNEIKEIKKNKKNNNIDHEIIYEQKEELLPPTTEEELLKINSSFVVGGLKNWKKRGSIRLKDTKEEQKILQEQRLIKEKKQSLQSTIRDEHAVFRENPLVPPSILIKSAAKVKDDFLHLAKGVILLVMNEIELILLGVSLFDKSSSSSSSLKMNKNNKNDNKLPKLKPKLKKKVKKHGIDDIADLVEEEESDNDNEEDEDENLLFKDNEDKVKGSYKNEQEELSDFLIKKISQTPLSFRASRCENQPLSITAMRSAIHIISDLYLGIKNLDENTRELIKNEIESNDMTDIGGNKDRWLYSVLQKTKKLLIISTDLLIVNTFICVNTEFNRFICYPKEFIVSMNNINGNYKELFKKSSYGKTKKSLRKLVKMKNKLKNSLKKNNSSSSSSTNNHSTCVNPTHDEDYASIESFNHFHGLKHYSLSIPDMLQGALSATLFSLTSVTRCRPSWCYKLVQEGTSLLIHTALYILCPDIMELHHLKHLNHFSNEKYLNHHHQNNFMNFIENNDDVHHGNDHLNLQKEFHQVIKFDHHHDKIKNINNKINSKSYQTFELIYDLISYGHLKTNSLTFNLNMTDNQVISQKKIKNNFQMHDNDNDDDDNEEEDDDEEIIAKLKESELKCFIIASGRKLPSSVPDSGSASFTAALSSTYYQRELIKHAKLAIQDLHKASKPASMMMGGLQRFNHRYMLSSAAQAFVIAGTILPRFVETIQELFPRPEIQNKNHHHHHSQTTNSKQHQHHHILLHHEISMSRIVAFCFTAQSHHHRVLEIRKMIQHGWINLDTNNNYDNKLIPSYISSVLLSLVLARSELDESLGTQKTSSDNSSTLLQPIASFTFGHIAGAVLASLIVAARLRLDALPNDEENSDNDVNDNDDVDMPGETKSSKWNQTKKEQDDELVCYLTPFEANCRYAEFLFLKNALLNHAFEATKLEAGPTLSHFDALQSTCDDTLLRLKARAEEEDDDNVGAGKGEAYLQSYTRHIEEQTRTYLLCF